VDARGADALVLGAGGAAQAVATALLEADVASLVVAARRPDAAGALAARLHTLFPGRDVSAAEGWPPDSAAATLVVNATPLRDELPLEPREGQAVVDLAYREDGGPTALVAAARGPVVDGLEVLVRQGAASFERWTGVAAPVDVMRAAVRSSA
jgi:shikimate dehydrogenase